MPDPRRGPRTAPGKQRPVRGEKQDEGYEVQQQAGLQQVVFATGWLRAIVMGMVQLMHDGEAQKKPQKQSGDQQQDWTRQAAALGCAGELCVMPPSHPIHPDLQHDNRRGGRSSEYPFEHSKYHTCCLRPCQAPAPCQATTAAVGRPAPGENAAASFPGSACALTSIPRPWATSLLEKTQRGRFSQAPTRTGGAGYRGEHLARGRCPRGQCQFIQCQRRGRQCCRIYL